MNRRQAFLSLLLLVGCRSSATPEQAPAAPRTARLQIVYEIDLAKAIDDRNVVIRRDLAVALDDKKIRATVRVTPEGVVITPEDLAKLPEIEAQLKADYADSIESRTCGAGLCVRTTDSMAVTIKKAALQMAVTTIRNRLDAMKVHEPNVMSRGEQIVVEVDAADDRAKAMRATLARTGTLEFKVVDHDSNFMRGVYALSAEDPRARELGIRADVDRWSAETGGSTSVDYYFYATDRAALEKYFAEIGRRDPRYTVADDRQLVFERGKGMWRSYYVERTAELTGKDIANAMGADDPTTLRPLIWIDFTRAGAQKLADVTARNVGRKLATILDGEVRSAPIINGTISGGKVSIAMAATGDLDDQHRERDELLNVLKTGSLPAPLREVSATPVP